MSASMNKQLDTETCVAEVKSKQTPVPAAPVVVSCVNKQSAIVILAQELVKTAPVRFWSKRTSQPVSHTSLQPVNVPTPPS